MDEPIGFEIRARDGAARAGLLTTAHGSVATPAFMPVATYGAVRGLAPGDLRRLGVQIVLANTYHLHERPGETVIAEAGGLHGFTGWTGPWLTDSGGFQVTSLAERVQIDEEGVTFASPLDGRRRQLTPEGAIAIQEALGSDIAMVLDECVAAERHPERAAAAMERSLRWAARGRSAHRRSDQALFGIVQGGAELRLRRESARNVAALGFHGHAHGGLGLGEPPERRGELIEEAHAFLPEGRPRYLMGLGWPQDLVLAIERGVDLFDCVVPTRHGRHGVLFTSEGRLFARNARYERDPGPPDADCDCPLCTEHSRSYLRHLFRSGEVLGARLATLHNLRFYERLLERARAAIAGGAFAALRDEVLATHPLRTDRSG